MRKVYLLLTICLFCSLAYSQQWQKRNLKYQHTRHFPLVHPMGIDFSDSATGFIASQYLFELKDQQWQPVADMGSPDGFRTLYVLNSRNVFMATHTQLMKYDGIDTSILFTSGRSQEDFQSIYMLDSLNGWLVGDYGAIYRITKDSIRFEGVTSFHYLRSVQFDSPEHGWAVGFIPRDPIQYGIIYEYTNGHWQLHSEIYNEHFFDVEFSSPNRGFVLGMNNIYKFDSASHRWIREPIANYHTQVQLSLLDDNYGISVGTDSTAMVYDNGTWTSFSTPNELYNIACTDRGEGWATSWFSSQPFNEGRIFQLKNLNWQPHSLSSYLDTVLIDPVEYSLTSIYGVDKKHVRINGEGIDLPASADWPDTIPVFYPSGFSVDQFARESKFFDKANGWVLSHDYLRKWQDNIITPVSLNTSLDTLDFYVDMHMFDDTTAFISGMRYGFGFVNDLFFIGYFNGKTLDRSYYIPDSRFHLALHFADKRNGWCVGDSGLMIKYAGNQWQVQSNITQKALFDVFMIDSATGWICGQDGTLLKYTNNTWTQESINTTAHLAGLYFLDKNNGWVVGAGGVIFKYNGVEWVADTSNTTQDLYKIFMVNPGYGWAAGAEGTLLQYINPNAGRPAGNTGNDEIPSLAMPNPVSSTNLSIKFTLTQTGTTSIMIFNQYGTKVRDMNYGRLDAGEYLREIVVSDLQSGIYSYQIISGDKKTSGQFIKLH